MFTMQKNEIINLQKGDSIIVIAPSESFKTISAIGPVAAERVAKEFDLTVTYGKHSAADPDILGSYANESRIKDLHDAFADKSSNAIICATGGYNANELLPHIDWDIIRKNPKPFIGSSDATVLLNAIHAKTGIVTYHGPNFFRFGMKLGLEYTLQYFRSALFSSEPYLVSPSPEWSEDRWYRDQNQRNFTPNEGYFVVNAGSASGKMLGGNLCSLNLLQGTEYMPELKDAILFIEEDALAGDMTFGEFTRNLQSLLQQQNADTIRGVLIGRFFSVSEMTKEKMQYLVDSNRILQKIPVIANVDFGHTNPALTLPVGGTVEIHADGDSVEIKILRH